MQYVRLSISDNSEAHFRMDFSCIENKYIGDDTKAAARQSLNCIKNKK